MYKILLTVIVLLILSINSSFSQTKILLTDSTKVEGKIIKYENGEYTIETSYGKLIISDKKILNIQNAIPDVNQNQIQYPQGKIEEQSSNLNSDYKIKFLTKSQYNKVLFNRISGFVGYSALSLFTGSNYYRNNSSYSELASNIKDPQFPISSTAGYLINEKKRTNAFEIVSLSVSIIGIGYSLKEIKNSNYKENKVASIARSSLMLGGIVFYILGTTSSNKGYKSLEDCVAAYEYNDNSQVEYANKSADHFAKASNYYLLSTILFGNAALMYIFDFVDLKSKYKIQGDDLSFGFSYNFYSKTYVPSLIYKF